MIQLLAIVFHLRFGEARLFEPIEVLPIEQPRIGERVKHVLVAGRVLASVGVDKRLCVCEHPLLEVGTDASVDFAERVAVAQPRPQAGPVDAPFVHREHGCAVGWAVSMQAFEFADASFDQALAAELGAAIGAVLDQQILNGSGSSGQMRGLLNVSGITSVAKTNASPTAATNYAAISDLVKQTSDAYGGIVDSLLMAPRRFAFIESKLGHAPSWLRLRPAVAGAMPENLGGSSNEDRVIAIPAREIILHVNQPRFQVFAEVLGATLQIRVQALYSQPSSLAGCRLRSVF
jgi:hypothetical protein